MAVDENRFDFDQHRVRMGYATIVEEDGRRRIVNNISPQLAAKWEREHKCATIEMKRKDGLTIRVNAHAKDDQAEWAKQGYELPPELLPRDPLKALEEMKRENNELKEKLNALIAGLEAKKGK